MKILLDHNVDRRLRRHLPGHEIVTTRQIRCELLSNGLLLNAAAERGADVFLTIDKKIEYEQNLLTLPLPVVIVDALGNSLEYLEPFAPHLPRHLDSLSPATLHLLQRDGSLLRITAPRARS
jgi:hypothetical protein